VLRTRPALRDWFLRCGTTTIEAKSGYGLSLEDELKILRASSSSMRDSASLRADVSRRAQRSAEYRARRDEYVSLIIEEMLPRCAARSWLSFATCFARRKFSH
jgi:imidazolonepropionase